MKGVWPVGCPSMSLGLGVGVYDEEGECPLWPPFGPTSWLLLFSREQTEKRPGIVSDPPTSEREWEKRNPTIGRIAVRPFGRK